MSRLLVFLSMLAVLTCTAQTATDLNEGLRVEAGSTPGSFVLKWYGKTGRTYFIQTSETLMKGSWVYTPVIEVGTNAVIQWGYTSSAGYSFVRLTHTDQSFTGSVANADFDGDGLSNYTELNTHHSNPLAADEDDDGLDDGVEVVDGTSTKLWDTDGDGYSDHEEKTRGTNANSGSSTPTLASVPSGSSIRLEKWGAASEIQTYQSFIEGYAWSSSSASPIQYTDNSFGGSPAEIQQHYETAVGWADTTLDHKFFGPDISAPDVTGDLLVPLDGGHGFPVYWLGEAYSEGLNYGSNIERIALRMVATSAESSERVFRLPVYWFLGQSWLSPNTPSPPGTHSFLDVVTFTIPATKTIAEITLPQTAYLANMMDVHNHTLYFKPKPVLALASQSKAEHFFISAAEFITPAGNPVTAPVAAGSNPTAIPDGANEFTFSSASTGVLTVKLKVKMPGYPTLPTSMQQNIKFVLPSIGGTSFVWASGNQNGQPTQPVTGDILEAVATLTGLPASNTDFGKKSATLNYSTVAIAQAHFEVFFAKDATNHPGAGSGTTPNWYHYWAETAVPGYDLTSGTYGYSAGSPSRYAQYNSDPLSPHYTIFGPGAASHEQYTTTVQTVNRKGIDTLAASLVHEKKHREVDQNWLSGGIWYGKLDSDSDELPDDWEDAHASQGYNKNNDTSFPSLTTGFPYGDDEEMYCEQAAYGVEGVASKDWANPGKQSINPF